MKVLLVGEGDFSFTNALCQLWSARRTEELDSFFGADVGDDLAITATSLDTFQEMLKKYPSFVFLKFPPSLVTVVHGVNALDCGRLKELTAEGVEYVVWNHPHLGSEDCTAHFELLCHFFRSMATVAPEACIILSFLDAQLTRWRVVEAALTSGFKLYRCERLEESNFPNYQCRRNLSGESFKSARSKDNWADCGGEMQSVFCYFRAGEDVVPIPLIELAEGPKAGPGLQCGECPGKRFKSEQGLRTHIRQVHELGLYAAPAQETCDVCGKLFHSATARDMHLLGAHGARDVKRRRLDHQRETVSSPEDYSCEICGSKDPLHVARFGQNKPQQELACNVCDKGFKSQRALNQHSNVAHPPHSLDST